MAEVAMLYLSRSNASGMHSAWNNNDGGDAHDTVQSGMLGPQDSSGIRVVIDFLDERVSV